MTKHKKIRLAVEDDSASILQIYAPFITNTAVTFECTVPTPAEFRNRMANIQRQFPWLVCEINGQVVGYAYASRFHEREAYDWSVDFSVYVDPQYHRMKIGKALYFCLIETLKRQGYYNACAIVTMPNIKSERFHEAYGFETIGVFPKVGYKFGGWHDVKWYDLKMQDHTPAPEKPKTIDEISNTGEFKMIIEKAEKTIQD